ncbi:MAG: HlyD family efflux transporter periplasmic adaptor subunit [Gammaproteobacteria bacterium]|nr:HlyD family efflux transporter periplasmic adaptor subunit [Gammaproteobacteria bacterium]
MQSRATAPFALLLQLEAEARGAETGKALEFLIANDTRRILRYGQSFVFRAWAKRLRLTTISSVAVVDRHTPAVRWMEKTANWALKNLPTDAAVMVLSAETVPAALREEWDEFSFPYVVFAPFWSRRGTLLGGMWLGKDDPWSESELALVERIGQTYSHAWVALLLGEPRRSWISRNFVTLGFLGLLTMAMLLPVRMSALAPSEVVARDPSVATAPIDAVVKEIAVEPNSLVSSGDVLFTFEDTELRNNVSIAERRLEVVQAAIAQAQQGAFFDDESRSRVGLLRSEVALAKIELAFARELLAKTVVRAEKPGLALYADAADWKGRPVRVGEKIMEIADPGAVKLRIELPVDDALVIGEEVQVDLFLDIDPLRRHPARIEFASYEAERTDGDVLAFTLEAELLDSQNLPRIGLKGTAKVYGGETRLFFFLFRRPLSALRQYIGF